MSKDLPHLSHIIRAYFHQDFDLIADDIEGLMADYVRSTPRDEREAARSDIERYIKAHERDLDDAFSRAYGFHVDPKLWGYTTEGFLRKLASLIG